MSNFLKYGDKVIIQSSYTRDKKKQWGFLSAEGFFNEKLYFEIFDPTLKKNKNLRENLFVLCPTLNCEFHQEYLRSLKFYKKIKKIKKNSLNNDYINKGNVEIVLKDLEEKLKKLQNKMDIEKEINEDIMEKKKGEYIRYEDQFQLYHYASKYFLTSKNVCSNTSAIGYVTEMSNIFSEDMNLKILPRFNSFQNGDFIQYNDEVKLQSSVTEFYLTINFGFGEVQTNYQDNNFNNTQNDLLNIANLNLNETESKYGTFFNHTSKNSWVFLNFPEIEDSKMKKLNVDWFDLVRIYHINTNSLLKLHVDFDNIEKIVLVEENPDLLTDNFVEYLWQFDMLNINLEYFNKKKFGKIKDFCLYNIFYNRFFGLDLEENPQVYKSVGKTNNKLCKINYEFPFLDNNMFMTFKDNKLNLINNQNEDYLEVDKNLYLYFKNIKEDKVYFSIINRIKELGKNGDINNNCSDSDSDSDFFIIDENKNFGSLGTTSNPLIEDCFIFQKIDKEEQAWIFYSLSLIKVLKKILNNRNFENFLRKIDKHLVEIIMFLFDDQKLLHLHFSNTNYYKNLTPNKKKQTILKELKIFELLIKILEKLNSDQKILKRKENLINGKDCTRNSYLIEKLISCKRRVFYSLLFMIKNNKKNQKYLSKWIDEFINQFFDRNSTIQEEEFNYQILIKKIFKNNQEMLLKKLSPKKIQKKLMKIIDIKLRFEKLIEILQFLHVVYNKNKRGMLNCIYELLFIENIQMFIKIKKIEGNFIVEDHSGKKIDLKKYNNKFENHYNFSKFFEVIVLFAKEGDRRIISKLKTIYEGHFDHILKLLRTNYLFEDFKIVFLKMILYIWQKSYPNRNIKYLLKIKKFVNIPKLEKNDFFIEIKPKKNFNSLIRFIYDISSFEGFKSYDINRGGIKKIKEFPEMIFLMISNLLDYGYLNHLSDVKNLFRVIVVFIKKQNLISTVILNFINHFIEFNHNYTLNLILKKFEDKNLEVNKSNLGFFSFLKKSTQKIENPILEKIFKNIENFILNNETRFFSYIDDEFMYSLFKNFCNDQKSSQNNIIGQSTLKTLKNIFDYNKNFIKYLVKVIYIKNSSNEVYIKIETIKNKILEMNNSQNLSETNKEIFKNVYLQIMHDFFKNKKLIEILEFYDKQYYQNIYEDFQMKEKNLYLYLHLYNSEIIPEFQNLTGPLELIDVLIETIEGYEIYLSKNKLIFQEILWILFVFCKGNNFNCLHFWKKYKTNLFKYLKKPNMALFMLFSEIIKNNKKILKNTCEVKYILNIIFSKQIVEYCQKRENLSCIYFILDLLQNLILFNNKIIFKNQLILSDYLDQLENLNENITRFLLNPNIIKWEFHEIDMFDKSIKVLNPEIMIYCKVLDLLALLAKGRNNLSDNSVRNMFSLKNLMEVLCNEYPISLKMSVLKFFINSYFFVEKTKIFPVINEIIFCLNEKFFKQILNVFMKYKNNFNKKQKIFLSNDYNGTFANFEKEYISWNLLIFIILLIKIHRKYSQFEALIKVKILKPLRKHILHCINDIFFEEKDLIEQKEILSYLIENDLQIDEVRMKEKIVMIVHKLLFKGINVKEIFNESPIPEEFQDIGDYKEFFMILSQGKNINCKNFFINYFKTKPESDFLVFYKKIFHSKNFEKNHKNFFQALNKYLINNITKINEKEKIFCFNLMKKYLESLNPKQEIPISEWSEETIKTFDQNREFLVKQNYIGSKGTIEAILYYIQNENNLKILIEIFDLGNALLLGGNNDIQNLFYYKIKEKKSNEFLVKINDLIHKLFNEIITSYKINNKIEKKKIEQCLNFMNRNDYIENEIFNEEKLYEKNFEIERIKIYFILLKSIFRFLQLLTEGQYKNFQKYLTNQNCYEKNVNIILTTSVYLKEFLEFNFIDDHELKNHILDFLIEIIQGPHILNQKMMFEFKIVDTCKSYIYELGLNEKIFEDIYIEKFSNKYNKSIKKIIKLFYSMLESNLNESFIISMKNNMDKSFFGEKLKKELKEFLKNKNIPITEKMNFEEIFRKKKIYLFDEEIQDSFDYFFLSKKLNIKLTENDIDSFNYLEFYELYSGHIEIKINMELKTIYFIIHPLCKYLNPTMQKNILTLIERKDKNERMNFLFDYITTIFLNLENEAKISESSIMSFFKKLKIREAFVIMAVVLNLYIVFFMGSQTKFNVITPNFFDFKYGNFILQILINILLYICIIRLILFTILNFKIVFFGYWRRKLTEYSTMIDKNTLKKQEKRILKKYNDTALSSKEIMDIIKLFITFKHKHKVNNLYLKFYFYFHGTYNFLIKSKFM